MIEKMKEAINTPIRNRDDYELEVFKRHTIHCLICGINAMAPSWVIDRLWAYTLVKHQGFTYTELGAKTVDGVLNVYIIEDHLLIDGIVTNYQKRQQQKQQRGLFSNGKTSRSGMS